MTSIGTLNDLQFRKLKNFRQGGMGENEINEKLKILYMQCCGAGENIVVLRTDWDFDHTFLWQVLLRVRRLNPLA